MTLHIPFHDLAVRNLIEIDGEDLTVVEPGSEGEPSVSVYPSPAMGLALLCHPEVRDVYLARFVDVQGSEHGVSRYENESAERTPCHSKAHLFSFALAKAAIDDDVVARIFAVDAVEQTLFVFSKRNAREITFRSTLSNGRSGRYVEKEEAAPVAPLSLRS